MANFTKFVTNMPLTPARSLSRKDSVAHGDRKPITRRQSLFAGFKQTLGPRRDTLPALHSPTLPASPTSPTSPTLMTSPTSFTNAYTPVLGTPEITLTTSPPAPEHGATRKAHSGADGVVQRSPSPLRSPPTAHASLPAAHSSPPTSPHGSLAAPVPTRGQALRRALSGSLGLARTGGLLRRSSSSSPAPSLRSPPASESAPPRLEEEEVEATAMVLDDAPRRSSPVQATPQKEASGASSDVAGPRFQLEPQTAQPRGERYAGEVEIYSDIPVSCTCLPASG